MLGIGCSSMLQSTELHYIQYSVSSKYLFQNQSFLFVGLQTQGKNQMRELLTEE